MIEGGWYDVSNRFARGEEIFADPEEAIVSVDRLQTKARDGFAVLAWVLMSNHGDNVDAVPWWKRDRQLEVGPGPTFRTSRWQ